MKITEQHIPCESCGSSDAKCIYEDGHGYCFSCNAYFPAEVDEDVYTFEYLPWRGIDKKTMKRYNVKTKINKEGKPISLGFEAPNGSYKVRQLDKKAFHTVGNRVHPGLFGRNIFPAGGSKYVVVTEGELDALSLHQLVPGLAVVSVQSGSSARSDCALERQYLNSYERIYLCFDGDAAGRRATEEVARLFDFNKVYDCKLPGGERKDCNDYLRSGDGDTLVNIYQNAKKYLPESIISSNAEFEKILNEEPEKGIPYPFPTLTYMTYGIRTGESVLVTAMEGVGKTEFLHAILHQTLKETKENVGAIFLEEPKRRLLQSVAGIEIKRPVHLPDCGVKPGEVYSALTRAVGRDDRLYVYSHFGSDDPEVLLDTIRFLVSARDVRYIYFDHVGMAVSGLGGEDERKALDYIVTRLEMMVKELNFALIFVSHVNDNGLTRGSRYISKIADIRIDLFRDVISTDPVRRLQTDVSVSKNRFSGRTGPAGKLLFNPYTHILTEDLGYVEASNDNVRIAEVA